MSFTQKQEKVNTKSNNRRKENIKDDQSQQRDSSYKFKVKPYKLTKKNKRNILKPMQPKPNSGSKTVKVTFKNVTGYASYKVQMKAGKAAYKTVKKQQPKAERSHIQRKSQSRNNLQIPLKRNQ